MIEINPKDGRITIAGFLDISLSKLEETIDAEGNAQPNPIPRSLQLRSRRAESWIRTHMPAGPLQDQMLSALQALGDLAADQVTEKVRRALPRRRA